MDHSVNFNGMAMDHTEYETGVYDEHSISISSKFLMFGYPSEMRIGIEGADAFVELFRLYFFMSLSKLLKVVLL